MGLPSDFLLSTASFLVAFSFVLGAKSLERGLFPLDHEPLGAVGFSCFTFTLDFSAGTDWSLGTSGPVVATLFFL